MPDCLLAAAILLCGCLVLAGVEAIGRAADRRRRYEWLRQTRRST